MNRTGPKPKLRPQPGPTPQPKRGYSLMVLVGLGVLVVGMLAVNSYLGTPKRGSSGEPKAAATKPSGTAAATVEVSSGADTAQSVPGEADTSRVRARPGRDQVTPAPGSPAVASGFIAQVARLDMSRGSITPAQAQQIKEALGGLVGEGAASLPAIREFLQKNQDLNFGEGAAKLAGVPSLRVGLLQALSQIGGPEALDLSRQVLKATADPLEIALLTQTLEASAPGQYRQDVVDAARQSLAQAAAGTIQVKDVAPLFQVLQAYGGTAVVEDLMRLTPNWNYYATMALAGMPSGEGIPGLIQLAQTLAAGGKSDSIFPLQMLAQAGVQYPDAVTVLADLATKNQISDRAWSRIGDALAGDQYQFARTLPDGGFAAVNGPGLKTYHIVDGNQNFFSTPVASGGAAPDTALRLALIDQLLMTSSSNLAAVQALTQARSRLSGPGTGK